MIGIWDMKMKMTNTLKVESGLVKSRNLWITSMAVLHNLSHKIAIASTSKEISKFCRMLTISPLMTMSYSCWYYHIM